MRWTLLYFSTAFALWDPIADLAAGIEETIIEYGAGKKQGSATELLQLSDFDATEHAWLQSERWIITEDSPEPVIMTELEKIQYRQQRKAKGQHGLGFMDVTHTLQLGSFSKNTGQRQAQCTYGDISHQQEVNRVIDLMSTNSMRDALGHFTSFTTRWYRSQSGKESQKWLLKQIQGIVAESRSNITVEEYQHEWGQPSIVARFHPRPSDDDMKIEMDVQPRVVISAHQDSINVVPFLPAPGADDDGSGTVTILEAFRALASLGYAPTTRMVEFAWWSAEEGGLLGSQAVAAQYEAAGVSVCAMIQMDMVAWVKAGTAETMGVIVDFVDAKLTQHNKQLIETYATIPWVETKCGYACSDHASFSQAGYPASFVIESSFENSNQRKHSIHDTFDTAEFSFEHMMQFARLAVGFAVELGGWALSVD